jgi:hypothetical protein
MRRGVIFEARVRSRAPRAALVKQDDAIEIGIEKATVIFLAPGARTAVHEQHRQPHDVAAFLEIKFMRSIDSEPVRRIGFDFWEKLVQGIALERFGFDLQVSGVDDAPEVVEIVIILVSVKIAHDLVLHFKITQPLIVVFFYRGA